MKNVSGFSVIFRLTSTKKNEESDVPTAKNRPSGRTRTDGAFYSFFVVLPVPGTYPGINLILSPFYDENVYP